MGFRFPARSSIGATREQSAILVTTAKPRGTSLTRRGPDTTLMLKRQHGLIVQRDRTTGQKTSGKVDPNSPQARRIIGTRTFHGIGSIRSRTTSTSAVPWGVPSVPIFCVLENEVNGSFQRNLFRMSFSRISQLLILKMCFQCPFGWGRVNDLSHHEYCGVWGWS
jgi:hypothetical protein